MTARDANLESLARLGVMPTAEELEAVGVTVDEYREEYLAADAPQEHASSDAPAPRVRPVDAVEPDDETTVTA